jgi:hypothetical protein
VPYGLSITYQLGADWLAACPLVEDWGCGRGYLTTFIERDRYRGVDGSPGSFADIAVDLSDYRSDAPGVFMRHVLEHDYRWPRILANALTSARERMFLAIFTPTVEYTDEIAFNADLGVPDIAFRPEDLTYRMDRAGFIWSAETLETPTQYGSETVFRLERIPR